MRVSHDYSLGVGIRNIMKDNQKSNRLTDGETIVICLAAASVDEESKGEMMMKSVIGSRVVPKHVIISHHRCA